MELTKQDKKHIQERVRKLSFRIVEEAKEYMLLHENTYYEDVINKCQLFIYISIVKKYQKKSANNET